jgi:protocatechuate 3,4-dioxygenase beta subunit
MSSSRLSTLNIVLLFVTVAALMFGAYGFVMNGGQDARPANTISTDDLDEFGGGQSNPIDGSERPKRKRPDGSPADEQPGRSKPVSPTGGDDATTKYDTEVPETSVESNPSDHGDAVIEGTVIDSANAPVSGATVTARRSDLDLDPPAFESDDLVRYRDDVAEFLAKAARETRTTTSASDGKFSFKGLDAGLAYDLAARTETAAGDQRRVAAGDSIVILLAGQSALFGRVQTKDGKPVTDFSVRAWRLNRQWEAISRSFEDEEGRFSLPAKAGTMQVEITAAGFTQEKPKDVEVGTEAVIVLDQAAILTGVVTDKEGLPLGDVVVRVGGAEENWQRGWNQENNGPSARTDSKGRYRFDTLTPKETKFTASLGEMSETHTTTLTQGENTLDFKMHVGAVLRLRLTDPEGKPIEPEQVWFQEKGNRGWPRPEKMPSKEPGLAEYAGMKPGEYTMTVTVSSYPAINQDITVTEGSNELSLKFAKGAMLTGIVTSSTGSKISNIGVRLRKEEEDRWGGWGTGRYAQVADDGTYKLGPAEPGQWRVELYSTSNWSEVYSGTVTIAEGENSHNIVVDAGATVTIKLLDDQGNPLAWGNVQLQGMKSYNGQSNGEGVTTLTFVEVGSYSMIASGNGQASQTQYVSFVAGDNQITVKLQKPNCCRVTYVYPDTQASKLGLQVGDLIVEYNGQTITGWGNFGQAVRATKDVAEVTMVIERGGSTISLTLAGGQVGIEGSDGVR